MPSRRSVSRCVPMRHGKHFPHDSCAKNSIPDAAGVAFDTPEGIVLHTGDFKLDPTPIDGVPTDLRSFAAIGARGVRLLLADSTNAEVPGYVPSETTVGEKLDEIEPKAMLFIQDQLRGHEVVRRLR